MALAGPAGIDQVGVRDDDFDIRSGRVLARGKIFASSTHAPSYLVAFEYKGFDSDPNVTWSLDCAGTARRPPSA